MNSILNFLRNRFEAKSVCFSDSLLFRVSEPLQYFYSFFEQANAIRKSGTISVPEAEEHALHTYVEGGGALGGDDPRVNHNTYM